MSTTIVVQAVPGRPYTAATVESIDGAGGASQLAERRILYWTGLEAPPFPLPAGWDLHHDHQAPAGHRRDLWRLMTAFQEAGDLVLFEDDVIACRNAIPYMVRWPVDAFTTFFDMRRPGYGAHQVDPKWGFWGSQAIKIPQRLLRRLVAAGDTDPNPTLRGDGGDTRIGRLLLLWKEAIYYHRSLVQHVGAISTHNRSATLTGLRAPATDFDPAFDALTLVPPV